MKIKHAFNQHSLVLFTIPGLLLLITLLSGFVLIGSLTYADASTTKTSSVSVIVNAACTITTGGGIYSKTIDPGTFDTITGNNINVSCNDTGGYALYAIGFSGDSYDTPNNNRMLGAGSNYIPAGNSGTDSYWAMSATASGTNAPTIDNSFSSYQPIPATYTKISHYGNVTVGATNNSVTTPSYKINVSTIQAPDTYTGKVKYTMVHPDDAAAPSAKTIADATYMQEVGSCPSTLTTGMVYQLTDNRDNQKYLVAKLKDGKCWMLQNLKLGRSTSTLTLTPANSDVGSNYVLDNKLSDGKFHAYIIDGASGQNNSTEYYCTGDDTASDWESCYYNWYTATAGTGTTYVATQGQSVSNSICPAGWTLPTSGSGGQFQQLYDQYPSAAEMLVANPTTTKENTLTVGQVTNTPGFLLSGYYNTVGAVSLGVDGNYWSRTAYSAQNGYHLYLDTSSGSTARNNGKYRGLPIRCLTE